MLLGEVCPAAEGVTEPRVGGFIEPEGLPRPCVAKNG